MAWLTKIRADGQVEYRLREQAGCGVVESDGVETTVLDDAVDAAVDYRLRQEGDGHLVWVGSGVSVFGWSEGEHLDDEAKDAVRRIMNGTHPATGARMMASTASVRTHPDAHLTVARLTEAIEALAAEKGVEPAQLLEGKPKQQRELATQLRQVNRFGEGQRLQVGTLHKLARAVGLDLADVYGEAELAKAWANKDKRIDTRVKGWDLVLDLPKSDSAVSGLMGELDERDFRDLVQQAKNDTVRLAEKWIGYAVTGEGGELVRIATGGLIGWSVEHLAARPVTPGEPGDPHLHVHVTIANVALCEDGQWRSIARSGKDFHRHASALDAYFKARVRELTYARFGIRRELNPATGAWGTFPRNCATRSPAATPSSTNWSARTPRARSGSAPPTRPAARKSTPTRPGCGPAGAPAPRPSSATSTRWWRPPHPARPTPAARPSTDPAQARAYPRRPTSPPSSSTPRPD
ncbi:relaxase domain-containing protein [Streptomyces sp. NPDC050164]|uniref:relaxase domain-containing protein n=1 Tax=Streptomyces sp. NPDC050164 TaxID=3365605 RepID=UPI0037A78B69